MLSHPHSGKRINAILLATSSRWIESFRKLACSAVRLASPKGFLRQLTVLCLAGLVAACTLTPSFQPPLPGEDDAPLRPETMQHWQASGKISLRFDGKNTKANLVWTNRADDYTIRLFGPIGLGAATLEKAGDKVELASREGTFQSSSGEALLREHLGIFLPVDEMHSWIKGLAYDGKYIQQGWSENLAGEFLSLKQSNWEIQFSKRQAQAGLDPAYTLPGKIKAEFPGDKSLNPVKIIVVIKEWVLGEFAEE